MQNIHFFRDHHSLFISSSFWPHRLRIVTVLLKMLLGRLNIQFCFVFCLSGSIFKVSFPGSSSSIISLSGLLSTYLSFSLNMVSHLVNCSNLKTLNIVYILVAFKFISPDLPSPLSFTLLLDIPGWLFPDVGVCVCSCCRQQHLHYLIKQRISGSSQTFWEQWKVVFGTLYPAIIPKLHCPGAAPKTALQLNVGM